LSNLDLKKRYRLLNLVDSLEYAIKENNKLDFFNIINEGWTKKKETSSLIMANPRIGELDDYLAAEDHILAHRLCGAGSGGFFLVFAERDNILDDRFIPISISEEGLKDMDI